MQSRLAPSARAVLLWLAHFTDSSGRAFPSHSLLAHASGFSERTVKRALTEAREAGFVEWGKGTNRGPHWHNVYTIRVPMTAQTECHSGLLTPKRTPKIYNLANIANLGDSDSQGKTNCAIGLRIYGQRGQEILKAPSPLPPSPADWPPLVLPEGWVCE